MKPKRVHKIGKAASGLLPHVAKRRTGSGTTVPASAPSQQPASTQPAAVVPQTPVKSGIRSITGWTALSEPVIYPQWPNVLFANFKNPNYVTLRGIIATLDLFEEVYTLGRVNNRKVVIEMPPLWVSRDVNRDLIYLHNELTKGTGKLVLFYPQWCGQATTMQSLSKLFPIPVANDRDLAARIALGQAQPILHSLGLAGTPLSPGSGQGFSVPSLPTSPGLKP